MDILRGPVFSLSQMSKLNQSQALMYLIRGMDQSRVEGRCIAELESIMVLIYLTCRKDK